MVIRHRHLIAGDGVGNAKGGAVGRAQTLLLQITLHRFEQRGVVGAGQHLYVVDDSALKRLPAEAGVGAANVAEQARVGRGAGNERVARFKHLRASRRLFFDGEQFDLKRERGVGRHGIARTALAVSGGGRAG